MTEQRLSVTLDASVWSAAMSAGEREHARCSALVESLVEQRVPLQQPRLFIIEVCATIARRTRKRNRDGADFAAGMTRDTNVDPA